MRSFVERLLASHDSGGVDVFRTPAYGETAAGRNDSAPLVPERIGHYRIIQKIGEGGMGTVYKARQDNPKRIVALKVIRPEIASQNLLDRFRFEAQVLGRLQHPGIAQIHEAGTAPMGPDGTGIELPYFAMEYVHGRLLSEFVDATHMDIPGRLALIIDICDAVHHAHQKGVIHRDLKPTNILVTEERQPKILDFGVARLGNSDIQISTLRTKPGQLIGTISYMSPEQVAGDPHELDIRSDVYALGAICYQLLTGRMPYDLQNKTIPEAARLISEKEPTPLSRMSRVFDADLTTIVAKALEKERTRRYQSASDLAADIRRYLSNQPILARPATAFYQLRKFTKRNKPLVAGVCIAAAALTWGLIHVTWQRNRAVTAERLAALRLIEAQVEATKLSEINRFFKEMLSSADPTNAGPDVRVVDVLDRAAVDLAPAFAGQPEVRSSLQNTIGATYIGLGLYEKAADQLRTALATRTQAAGEDHPDTLVTKTNLAAALIESGSLDEAESLLNDVLHARRRRYGSEHVLVLDSLNNLADIYQKQGKITEAEAMWQQLLQVQRRALPRDDPQLLVTMNNLAQLLKQLGRPEEAEPLLRESLRCQRKTIGSNHPHTLSTMSNLAMTLKALGHLSEAEPLLREIIDVRRDALGNHPSLYASMSNLARLLEEQDRLAEAEVLARQAVEGFASCLGREHRATLTARNNLGALWMKLGRVHDAEELYKELIGTSRRVLPDQPWITAIFMRNHGRCLATMGRFEKAEPVLLNSYNRLKSILGEEHQHTQKSIEYIIDMYERWERPDDAARYRKPGERGSSWVQTP